jgi:predicted nucleotide-binding protein (sugar kinase/HSP70/actin superfamily)
MPDVARDRSAASVRVFGEEDRDRPILVPFVSRFYSPAISGPVIQEGYEIVTLTPPDRASVELGLKYANNEICYPGIIYIGDLIKALESGAYDPSKVAVGSWQTGGQCRASCILGALKRALATAGFSDVPVAALTVTPAGHEQPGFRIDRRRYAGRALAAVAYADAIAKMARAARARERVAGAAYAVAERHLARLADGRQGLGREDVLEAVDEATADFGALDLDERELPAAGIVGEVYLKHSEFSNHHVVDWLAGKGLEPIVPPLLDLFLSALLAPELQMRLNVRRPAVRLLVWRLILRRAQALVDEVDRVAARFAYYRGGCHIGDLAARAGDVVSLAHQYGESWLIAGEIGDFVRSGVKNVICLQPFGCIANHVVAKGVERRLKETYRGLNLLFLDADAGTSEVNFQNRLHFFVSHARTYT